MVNPTTRGQHSNVQNVEGFHETFIDIYPDQQILNFNLTPDFSVMFLGP